MKRIPKGKVSTYREIAKFIGKPNAFRAVGNTCNKNPNAPRVPCHRVVKSDGRVGGYAFGEKKKILLLQNEGIKVKKGRILNFEDCLLKTSEGR